MTYSVCDSLGSERRVWRWTVFWDAAPCSPI